MLDKRRAGWVLRLLVAEGLALLVFFIAACQFRLLPDRPLARGGAGRTL